MLFVSNHLIDSGEFCTLTTMNDAKYSTKKCGKKRIQLRYDESRTSKIIICYLFMHSSMHAAQNENKPQTFKKFQIVFSVFSDAVL